MNDFVYRINRHTVFVWHSVWATQTKSPWQPPVVSGFKILSGLRKAWPLCSLHFHMLKFGMGNLLLPVLQAGNCSLASYTFISG